MRQNNFRDISPCIERIYSGHYSPPLGGGNFFQTLKIGKNLMDYYIKNGEIFKNREKGVGKKFAGWSEYIHLPCVLCVASDIICNIRQTFVVPKLSSLTRPSLPSLSWDSCWYRGKIQPSVAIAINSISRHPTHLQQN